MDSTERIARRHVFGEAAEAYDRVRPAYPSAAINALIEAVPLHQGDRVLEIGCGTGQATVALAARELAVVALELSPALAALAERRVAPWPSTRVIVQGFETFEDANPFRAVVAASSYHWLDPTTRLDKIRTHLTGGGSLAVLSNIHPRPYTGFFEKAQDVYQRLVPEWGDVSTSVTMDDVMRKVSNELVADGRFAVTLNKSWDWAHRFATDEYLLLLSTYSDHRLLGPERLRAVQRELGKLIDSEYDGVVSRPYRTVLTVARSKG